MATIQPIDADESVRVPQPSNTQPRGASWRNDFASHPVSHGLRHPANVQQVTAASARTPSVAGSRQPVCFLLCFSDCIPDMLKLRQHLP